MLKADIQSNLGQIAGDFRSLEAKANDRLRAINIRGGRSILGIARGVVHVQSGRLRDSLRISGPFDIQTGTFEMVVDSPLAYADIEADRGGEHDYPTLTLEQSEGVINQVADDMEAALVLLIEG